MKGVFPQFSTRLIIWWLAFVFIFGGGVLAFHFFSEKGAFQNNEIRRILDSSSLDEQVELYEALIKRVGPEAAQEELLRSGLPFTGQTHLLNHTVGDYLYDNFGASGLIRCRDYFLSSCYHGFLIKAIGRGGIQEVKNVMEECKKARPGVDAQCSHAVGHGLLAWQGYKNLIPALKLCDTLGEDIENFPLFNCHDGVFMENIWAVHEDGTPSPDRWWKEDDPVYPCNDPRVEERYLKACWSNQPSLMYQLFQGDIARVGQECLAVENPLFQKTCFDGLARQIHPLTKSDVFLSFSLCGLMPSDWVDFCVITIAASGFGVGDREVPFQICAHFKDSAPQKECYRTLSGMIKFHARSSQEKQQWCGRIQDEAFLKECLAGQ